MIRKERRRQPLNQAEARSMNAASLQRIKKSPPKNSILFNSEFRIIYDRKDRKLILGDEEICRDSRRFKALSAPQAIILKTIKNTQGKFENRVLARATVVTEPETTKTSLHGSEFSKTWKTTKKGLPLP